MGINMAPKGGFIKRVLATSVIIFLTALYFLYPSESIVDSPQRHCHCTDPKVLATSKLVPIVCSVLKHCDLRILEVRGSSASVTKRFSSSWHSVNIHNNSEWHAIWEKKYDLIVTDSEQFLNNKSAVSRLVSSESTMLFAFGCPYAAVDFSEQFTMLAHSDFGCALKPRFFEIVVKLNQSVDLASRLLESLEASTYIGFVSLKIHTFGPLSSDLASLAAASLFSHGPKDVIRHEGTLSFDVRLSSLISSDGWSVTLEDGIIVSPLWFQWLYTVRRAHMHRTDACCYSVLALPVVNFKNESSEQVSATGCLPSHNTWNEFKEVLNRALSDSFWSAEDEGDQLSKFCLFKGRITKSYQSPAGVSFALRANFEEASLLLQGPWQDSWVILDNTVEAKSETNSAPPRDACADALALAEYLQAQSGFIFLQMLSYQYVEMVRSWLCNINIVASDILPYTLFITTDSQAERELKQSYPKLNVVTCVVPGLANISLNYGQAEYYKLMEFRSRLILDLISHKIAIFMCEADAVWLQSPVPYLKTQSGYDIIAGNDNEKVVWLVPEAGFMFLNHTPKAVDIWREVLQIQQEAIAGKAGDIGDAGNEMLVLGKLLLARSSDSSFSWKWFPTNRFLSGTWFMDEEIRRRSCPAVIQNNWIKGYDAKVQRAKEMHHWFLNDRGECNDPESRLTTLLSVIPNTTEACAMKQAEFAPWIQQNAKTLTLCSTAVESLALAPNLMELGMTYILDVNLDANTSSVYTAFISCLQSFYGRLLVINDSGSDCTGYTKVEIFYGMPQAPEDYVCQSASWNCTICLQTH